MESRSYEDLKPDLNNEQFKKYSVLSHQFGSGLLADIDRSAVFLMNRVSQKKL